MIGVDEVKAGGGKSKGAQFERDVCKELSLWISNGERHDIFWRSAMSGGRATLAGKKGNSLGSQAGDISCIHPMGAEFSAKFYMECKFYADLDYEGLVTNSGKLFNFWRETCVQASAYGKLPFLIAKQNRLPTIIGINKFGEDVLRIEPAPVLVHVLTDLHIYKADTFLSNVIPFSRGSTSH